MIRPRPGDTAIVQVQLGGAVAIVTGRDDTDARARALEFVARIFEPPGGELVPLHRPKEPA